MSLPASGLAYSSAWVAPFDKFSSEDWACFDEIDVFALAFDARGEVLNAYPKLLEQAAAAKPAGVKLLPVIVNDAFADGGAMKELKSVALLDQWLGDPRRLDRHVDSLAAAAADYDGLEIDYERIPARLWGPYVELIEKLGDKLHAQGKTLAVDVEAGPLFSKGGAISKEHWPRLAAAADKVKIMCYYERGEFSDQVGPGSSAAFVREVGRRALALMPADKVSLAYSLAATDWQVPLAALQSRRHVARLHFRKARELQAAEKARPLWDDRHGAPFFRYAKGGEKHEVYYEDERTLGEKVSVASSMGLGVSLWYLGAERPDLRALGLCRRR